MAEDGRWWNRRTITVMQFNALCKIYEPNHIPQARWDARFPRIQAQITKYACDIISLQECNPVSEYRRWLGQKYDIFFASKSGHNGSNMRSNMTVEDLLTHVNDTDDGAAICVKKGCFDVIHVSVLDCGDPQGDVARQFALMMHAYHHMSGRSVLVVAMHMKANNFNTKDDSIRLVHLPQILEQINHYRFKVLNDSGEWLPLLFLGDFNAAPEDPTMEFLMTGQVVCPQPSNGTGTPPPPLQLKHQYQFRSAMRDGLVGMPGGSPHGGEPPFTILDSSYSRGKTAWWSTLDYILYEEPTCHVPPNCHAAPRLQLTSAVTPLMVQKEELKDAVIFTGSDHIPLIAEFALC